MATPIEAADGQGPLAQSLWMLLADFLAAAIPIVPFAFLSVAQGRIVSGTVTMLLLVGLGIGRAWIGGRAVVRTVVETVSIGVAAALAGVSFLRSPGRSGADRLAIAIAGPTPSGAPPARLRSAPRRGRARRSADTSTGTGLAVAPQHDLGLVEDRPGRHADRKPPRSSGPADCRRRAPAPRRGPCGRPSRSAGARRRRDYAAPCAEPRLHLGRRGPASAPERSAAIRPARATARRAVALGAARFEPPRAVGPKARRQARARGLAAAARHGPLGGAACERGARDRGPPEEAGRHRGSGTAGARSAIEAAPVLS